MNAADLLRLAELQLPPASHELFRPYVWRDPARVTPQRAAELARADRTYAAQVDDRCGQPFVFCRCQAG